MAKTVKNNKGEKENVIFKGGYNVTLNTEIVYIRYTFYTDEERAADKSNSKD